MMLPFLFVALKIFHLVNPACDPINSKEEYFVKTFEGTPCYFPFKNEGTTYTDCALPTLYCASTCNYNQDLKFGKCKWPLSIKNDPICANLPNAKQSDIVITKDGRKCVFPFYYENKCYDDCVDADWCGVADTDLDTTIPEVQRYSYCYFTLADMKKPSCANFPNHAISSEPEVYPANNGDKDLCIFPFYYKGECYDECTTEDSAGKPWCSVDEVYDRKEKYNYCKYYRNYKTYSAPLSHGFYRIVSARNCPTGDECGRKIFFDGARVNAENKPTLVSHKNKTHGVHDHIFEILPQIDNLVIIRAVQDCFTTSSNEHHLGLSYSSSDWLVSLYDLGENREFWKLEATGTQNVFKVDRASGGSVWGIFEDGDYYTIKVFATSTSTFMFQKLSDSETRPSIVACEFGTTAPTTTAQPTTTPESIITTPNENNGAVNNQNVEADINSRSSGVEGSPTVVDDFQTEVLIGMGVIWSAVIIGGLAALIINFTKK